MNFTARSTTTESETTAVVVDLVVKFINYY